jgi:hypothetical protein
MPKEQNAGREEFQPLIEALREAAEVAGKTIHKPARQKSYAAVVMPQHLWDAIIEELEKIDG